MWEMLKMMMSLILLVDSLRIFSLKARWFDLLEPIGIKLEDLIALALFQLTIALFLILRRLVTVATIAVLGLVLLRVYAHLYLASHFLEEGIISYFFTCALMLLLYLGISFGREEILINVRYFFSFFKWSTNKHRLDKDSALFMSNARGRKSEP